MRIEIDQSGKIENTNRPTVIAFSNNKNDVLVLLAKDKKEVQKYFRKANKPRLFIYITFVVLIFTILKKHIKNYDQIVIDREYPGYEKLITSNLNRLLKKELNICNASISTTQIGKKSKAHDLAWNEFQLKSHENHKKICAEKLIKIIKKSGSI
jgi:hypothetical protein